MLQFRFIEIGTLLILLCFASAVHSESGGNQPEEAFQPQESENVFAPVEKEQDREDLGIFGLSLEEMMDVKVSVATKILVSVEKAPSIVSVVTAQEIRNMGARNLEDILRTIAGFDVISDNYGMRIGVRGLFTPPGTNNKFNIMIDGHSLRGSWLGGLRYIEDNISINNIKKIEIIRGPGSALYGTNSFFGVINIVTKDGEDEPSRASLSVGSFNTTVPNGEFSYEDDNIKAYIFAEYFKTDGPKLHIESDAAFKNWGESASAAPGKTIETEESFIFQTKIKYADISFNGMTIQGIDTQPKIGVAYALVDEDDTKESESFAELKFEHEFDAFYFSAKLFYDYHKYDTNYECFSEETASYFNNEYSSEEPYPAGVGMHGYPILESKRSGGEIVVRKVLVKVIDITGGLFYERSENHNDLGKQNANLIGSPYPLNDDSSYMYQPMQYLGGWHTDNDGIPMFGVRDTDRNVSAVYIQSIIDLKESCSIEQGAESLTLTAGVRYDDYDDVGSSTNPRLGIVYSPVEKLYFKLLYGEAFRAPSFYEMYARYNPTCEGNTELRPETITTIEWLVGYNFSRRIKSSITFFDIKIRDLIEKSVIPGQTRLQWENIGTVESQGTEVELKCIWDKYRYGYVNFSMHDSKDTTNKDFDMGGVSFVGNLGVNYDLTDWLIGNISINYVGERSRTDKKVLSEGSLVKLDQRDPIDARTLVNASLIKKNFLLEKMDIQLSGYNLLDEDHRDPDVTINLVNDTPRSDRTFFAKISYTY